MKLKILSLVLALCAWGYLRFSANSILQTGDRQASIAITIAGRPPGVRVLLDRQSVDVLLASPLDAATLAAGGLNAVVDVSQIPAGRHVLPVVVHSPIAVAELRPATVNATITQGSTQ